MPTITTERVWEGFHTPLQQFIRRRISDEAAAEDVLQDVFLRIHQHMDTLKNVRKLGGGFTRSRATPSSMPTASRGLRPRSKRQRYLIFPKSFPMMMS